MVPATTPHKQPDSFWYAPLIFRGRPLALACVLVLLLPGSLLQARTRRLDTTTFVVIGEGFAAGIADFGLSATVQRYSFPAQAARQMNALFPQPLIDPPGTGNVPGYPRLPVRVPAPNQTRVRIYPPRPNPNDEAPTLFVFNLSVPNMTLAESLSRRPSSPLVQPRDEQQTLVNLVLGFPSLILTADVPQWTQFEYAQAMNPTLALVALGYAEVVSAALAGDASRLPDIGTFRSNYDTVVRGLRGLFAEVIVTTIPDPIDTAYFSTAEQAAALLGVSAAELRQTYSLRGGDLLTPAGLRAIGFQQMAGEAGPLPPGSIVREPAAAAISAWVAAFNGEIAAVAAGNGAVVYDLSRFLKRVRAQGATVRARTVTARYMDGFYTLAGFYPTATGHALIANDLLARINAVYGTSFGPVDVATVAASDPAFEDRPAGQVSAAREIRVPERGRVFRPRAAE